MTSAQKTFIVGCVIGLLGAGGALLLARYQQSVRTIYGAEPHQLSLATLEQGYHGQRWVEVHSLTLGPRAVVDASGTRIDDLWVPVFPLGAGKQAPIQTVLRSSKSHSLEEFGLRLRDRTSFRGALVDESANLRQQLTASYPGQPLAAEIRELDIDFGGPSYSRWGSAIHPASGGLLVFGVICLLGFVGSCFGPKDSLESLNPGFNTVPELRY